MFQVNRSILVATLALTLSVANNSVLAREHSGGPKGDVDPKTGMRFPSRAGAFEREGGIEYDNAGYP